MEIFRKFELSMYYHIKNYIDARVGAGVVTTVLDYPNMVEMGNQLVPPVVAIVCSEVNEFDAELGNLAPKTVGWFIEVYTLDTGQRADLLSIVWEALNEGITVYDYDAGFTSPPSLGTMVPRDRNSRSTPFFESLNEVLYWRAVLSFSTDSVI